MRIFLIASSMLAASCAIGSETAQTKLKYHKEIEIARERAHRDDIEGMYLLVEMLTEMAPKHDKEAESWLRRAYTLGDKRAPRMLAEMLFLRGDDSGFYEAINLLKGAYKPGDFRLAGRIGSAYQDKGHHEESIGWLQASASEGDFDSAVELSNLYFEIERIRSSELSAYWACKAISLRNDRSFIIEELRKRVSSLGRKCSQ